MRFLHALPHGLEQMPKVFTSGPAKGITRIPGTWLRILGGAPRQDEIYF